MRPWLALRWAGIAFEEAFVRLRLDDGARNSEIAKLSPSGKVPFLRVEGVEIWDSLAICEWAAEQSPGLWPTEPEARGVARSASAEMHSGFMGLRQNLPMNLRRNGVPLKAPLPDAARADIARIDALFSQCRAKYGGGGDFLFGARSVADAMFAPVATRLRTYAISLSAPAQSYCEALLADAAFKDWEKAALAETWSIPETDEV
jgi:glutathione S-transferase